MSLHVLNDTSGASVDWWFLYKLPDNVKGPDGKKTTGKEYLYFDSESTELLSMSSNLIDSPTGALENTIGQLKENGYGYILYNDEKPGKGKNSDTYGHTKGVLAFDPANKDAFWLLHSWPKFPSLNGNNSPSYEYGQTYICIQLKDLNTANNIAEQMSQQNAPQVYDFNIPDGLDKSSSLYKLTQRIDVNETTPPSDITFSSKANNSFRMLAKNRHWDKDFWIDWVGPQLNTDLNVETWRRGTVPPTKDSNDKDDVQDILYINLENLKLNYEWHYTKDHSKWGSSAKGAGNWVCVADINRQTSQENRGGCTIAFQNNLLWKSLSQIEQYKK